MSTNKVSYYDSRLESTGEEIFEIYKRNTLSMKECFEKKLQLPEQLPIEFEMLQKAGPTVVLITYANKTDYYEIKRSGSVRTFKPRLDDDAITKLDELSDWENADEAFECPSVHLVDDRDYTILIVESPTEFNYGTQISAGYTYLINKETLNVSFKFYPNTTYSQCNNFALHSMDNSFKTETILGEIDIPQSKKEVINEFEHEIERCAKQQDLISSATNVSITRIDNHIRISVNYDGKYDYYVLNSKGYVCYAKRELAAPINGLTENAVQECDKTLAHEVYDSDFEECLNLRYAIPSDLPVKFNVSTVNHLHKHIDILVYDDGKYDYYELDMRGKAYYTDIRRDMNPTRTFEEHLTCDEQHPLGLCTYEYNPSFGCGYEVIKNETDVAIFVYADGRNTYEYNVDRGSGKTLLYRIDGYFNHSFEQTFDNCLKKKYATDFDIPLEVTMKTKKTRFGEEQNYLAISVKYQGKHDLYVTEDWGYVRYVETQLADEPNLTLTDYSNNNHVHKNMNVERPEAFRCPLKVVENESYVNVSVNAFHYDHVYTIDKSNNAMTYAKLKDNFVLSLPARDFELKYVSEVDKCMEKLSNFTGGPFPVTVTRNRNFIQISVEFNGTRHTYVTNSLGEQMCRIFYEPQVEPIDVHQLLEDVYPDCISRDDPALAFACPTLVLTEDENQVTMEIIIYPAGTAKEWFTYQLNKLSGTMTYQAEARGVFPASVSNVIKSLVG
ncbi:hypothetical protein HA402_013397 [Bradysia odoriphaga]|nr:hypothetical protein HA402_013397 [Bradysia odoriphaga]